VEITNKKQEMNGMLHVRSHKSRPTKDVVTRRVFESPNAFGGRAPLGELKRSPDLLVAIGKGVLLLRGRYRGMGRKGRRRKGRGAFSLTSGCGPVDTVGPKVIEIVSK